MEDTPTLTLEPNPDLTVVEDQKPRWNLPANRRRGFRSLDSISRYALSLRAPVVLPLVEAFDPAIARLSSVQTLIGAAPFCALVVVQGQKLLFESYARDMAADQRHSIQSISKMPMHLIMGRLIAAGQVDLDNRVRDYLPEIGSGYASATVQQVLDMDVINNFNEDYQDSYALGNKAQDSLGYNREEIAMGWRLPPPGEAEFSGRDFLLSITATETKNPTRDMQYRSPNTEVLAWIAERVSGRSLRELLIDVIEGAGIEGVYHISMDRNGVPVIAGGASLTARDLARYGLIFARGGRSVQGALLGGGPAFIEQTTNGRGTVVGDGCVGVHYSNHCYTNGRWMGHPGFAGQFLMTDPKTQTAIAFFSVLETKNGDQEGYTADVIAMGEDILGTIDSAEGS